MRRLDAAEVDAELGALPGWSRDGDALRCELEFASFAAAVAFTNRVAEVAEQLDHHPEWTVRYRRVALCTTTHDAGGLTRRDVDLARRLDELARRAGGRPT